MAWQMVRFTSQHYIMPYTCDIPNIETAEDSSKDLTSLDHHPNHVVTINTRPEFGLSLSAMANEDAESLSLPPPVSH